MKQKLSLLLIFVISFIAFVLLFGELWLIKIYGNVSINQILFHLSFPLSGVDSRLIMSFVKRVFIPSVLTALIVTFLPYVAFILWCKIFPFLISFIKNHTLITRFALCFVLLAISLVVIDKKFKVLKYAKTQIHKDYSSFYEENYTSLATPSLPKKPQNLVVIFVESLESTYSSQNIPKNIATNSFAKDSKNIAMGGGKQDNSNFSPFGELIPNLTKIALNNTNFSTTNTLGGIMQTSGAGWTIAGIVSYMCAIPLNMPIGGNDFNNAYFLSNATCIGDILDNLGYQQLFIQGSDDRFSGIYNFFSTHKVQSRGEKYFVDMGWNLKENRGFWGFKDEKIFSYAKEILEGYDKNTPFALYVATIDTHHPDGFVDREVCKELDSSFQSVVKCSDKIINDFVKFIQESEFGANTTIVILGDHLSMKQNFFPKDSQRFIYNAFINPHFSKKPTTSLMKNRKLSHFDISALILDSLGLRVESFGLGRNPLLTKTLLETYGIDKFNELILQDSKIYENFWKVEK